MLQSFKKAVESVTTGVGDASKAVADTVSETARKVTDYLPLPSLPSFDWLTWPDMSGFPTLSELGEITFGKIYNLFPDIDTDILRTVLEYKDTLGNGLLVLLKLIGDKNVTSILMYALTYAMPGSLLFVLLSYVIGVEVTGLGEEHEDGCTRFTITVFNYPGVSFVKSDDRYYCEIVGSEVTIQQGVATLLRWAGKDPAEFDALQIEDKHNDNNA